jgi:hypothetical protein
MLDQLFEPAQLIVEFRAGTRIAVGQIEPTDQDAVDSSFDVAALTFVRIAGQASPGLMDLADPAQDRDAVPAFLAVPDRVIAKVADRASGNFSCGAFNS